MTMEQTFTRTRSLTGRGDGSDPTDLVLGRVAFELASIDSRNRKSDPKAPFFALLDAVRAVSATTHISVWLRWGGRAEPRFRAFLLLSAVDGNTRELDAMRRVAGALFDSPRSLWSIRAVDPDEIGAPLVGDARRLRQTRISVPVGDGQSLDLPIRFAHPGRDSWDRLIAAMQAIENRADLVITITPTALTPDEESELDALALKAESSGAASLDARTRATIADVIASFRTPLSHLQILLVGADGLAEVEAGAVAASLSAGFDTYNGDGWRIVASEQRALIGGYLVEPVRDPITTLAAVADGRPASSVNRTLEDLVTFDELSYLMCWPIGCDLSIPGVPTGDEHADAALADVTGVDGAVVLGTTPDGRTVGVRALDRTQATAIIGSSGCGKSTLLTEIARQDAEAGRALWMFDPGAETLYRVAAAVPAEHQHRIFVFDLENPERSDRIDLLRCSVDDSLRRAIVDAIHEGLVTDLNKDFHGPVGRLGLSGALHVTAEAGASLSDLARVIEDQDFAQLLLRRVGSDHPHAAGLRSIHKGSNASVGEMIRWLGSKPAVLAEPAVGAVLGHQGATITVEQLLAPGAVVLIRPPHQAGPAHLITSILLEVLARAVLDRSLASPPLAVYLEEVQRASGKSLRGLLNESRKRNLFVHLATQHTGNLGEEADGVLTNAATLLLGRSRGTAARRLELEFGDADGRLSRLPNLTFEAVIPAQGQPVGPLQIRIPAPGPAPEEWPAPLLARIERADRAKSHALIADAVGKLVKKKQDFAELVRAEGQAGVDLLHELLAEARAAAAAGAPDSDPKAPTTQRRTRKTPPSVKPSSSGKSTSRTRKTPPKPKPGPDPTKKRRSES